MSAIRSGFRVSEEQKYIGIQGKKPAEMTPNGMISMGLFGSYSENKTSAAFHPKHKFPQPLPTGLASVYYAPTLFGAAASPPEWNYGAQVVGSKTRFKLWAPSAKDVDLVILKPSPQNASKSSLSLQEALNQRILESIPLPKDEKGNFFLEKNDVGAGTLYMYRLHRHDGTTSQLLPDLRTRFQPEDVHGPSEVIKLAPMKSYPPEMITLDKRKASVYHIHTGTFTEEGNFEGIIRKIGYIKDMGYTHVKLMPVDEFPGSHNWGYDGVHKFAIE
ncbi:MAG: hypothetical protein K2X66_03235, partial [Cyanobacteria bacterium]|nr:hypothetical protein [Cyanobacteriota bacterium]